MRRDEQPLPPPPRRDEPNRAFRCARGPGETPCSAGPNGRGRCGLAAKSSEADHPACHPELTWLGWRRRMSTGALVLFAITLLLMLGTPVVPEVVRPGDLSQPHAQILTGAMSADRCTACHQNVSTETWFARTVAVHGTTAMATMSGLCMKCHHAELAPETATLAHNLPADVRDKLHREALAASVDRGGIGLVSLTRRTPLADREIACAECHQEHHGADFNLSAINDARCQACHVERFGAFATSHPEFDCWPRFERQKTSSIAFDHVRHAAIHYPKQAEKSRNATFDQFECRACHVTGQTNDFTGATDTSGDPIIATLPYEVACAACHDDVIRVQAADGPALISLPTISAAVARGLDSWPDTAIGEPDGTIPPRARLLRQRSATSEQSTVTQQIAGELRELAIQLAVVGQPALLRWARDAGLDDKNAVALAASLPPQLIREAANEWFGRGPATKIFDKSPNDASMPESFPSDPLLDNSLLGETLDDGLLSGSRLDAKDPLTLPKTDVDGSGASSSSHESLIRELSHRYDPAKLQSLGGWVLDDLTLSLKYRGSGHADPVLAAMIRLAAYATPGSPAAAELLAHPALATCLNCHPGVAVPDHPRPWRAGRTKSLVERMTHFSHRPHLNVAVLQDCRQCHRLGTLPTLTTAPPPVTLTSVVSHPVAASEQFAPLSKAACAACHTPSAAGDRCTLCHRYHVR